ncbi:LysR family transcriptional regulator [Candidatus Endobugula sertula]|uniref:LysR family transcriptional regulator n=1 Tax=Candidatus Endobugula sertula TaxID=62101 RepID=A0A1D2QPB3_9GAMM|nr:LysR family transcriptional regulator [Candidatus Endobugula sertula]
MKYTLRQLEVFLAVAHHQNITRASEHLNMSQSAASSALKDLEKQFSIQLFDRVGKRLQINELGKIARSKAQALLEQARELEVNLREQQQLGHLKVGATLTIGNYLAVDLMARYMNEQPGARVSLDVANTESIARKVENFELDIGLIEGELQHPELDIVPWCEDELSLFCCAGHPYAAKEKLSDKDLMQADWIVRESGSGTRQAFNRGMIGLLPQLHLLLELQHTEAIKRAVEARLGIGCLSTIAIQDPVKRGSLIPLHAPHRSWRRHFYFVLHKQKYRSVSIDRWISICRSKTNNA